METITLEMSHKEMKRKLKKYYIKAERGDDLIFQGYLLGTVTDAVNIEIMTDIVDKYWTVLSLYKYDEDTYICISEKIQLIGTEDIKVQSLKCDDFYSVKEFFGHSHLALELYAAAREAMESIHLYKDNLKRLVTYEQS